MAETNDTLLLYLSVCGTISSIVLLLSPLPSFVNAYKAHDVRGINIEFVFATNVSQISWLLYSFFIEQPGLLYPSLLGCGVSLLFLIVHRCILGSVTGFLLKYCTSLSVIVAIMTVSLSVTQLGWICMSLSIVNCLSALLQTQAAIVKHDPSLIDLNITVALVFSGVSWGTFGIVTKDLFVFCPNVAAEIVALANFCVLWRLQGSCPRPGWPKWPRIAGLLRWIRRPTRLQRVSHMIWV